MTDNFDDSFNPASMGENQPQPTEQTCKIYDFNKFASMQKAQTEQNNGTNKPTDDVASNVTRIADYQNYKNDRSARSAMTNPIKTSVAPCNQAQISALAKAIFENEGLKKQFLDIVLPNHNGAREAQNPIMARQTEKQATLPPNKAGKILPNPQNLEATSIGLQEAQASAPNVAQAFGQGLTDPYANGLGTQQVTTCALDGLLAEVEACHPNFFGIAPARVELKTYLRENCPNLARDEVLKVLKLATALERQAIEAYKSSLAHQKGIFDHNAQAISKLMTNSSSGNGTELTSQKVFTRAEIGRMTPEEFKRNERAIFSQYRNGLIK